MAVRFQRASVPSLAAGGFCGLLHEWGASFSEVGGGLVSSSPASFGVGGRRQALRWFSGRLPGSSDAAVVLGFAGLFFCVLPVFTL